MHVGKDADGSHSGNEHSSVGTTERTRATLSHIAVTLPAKHHISCAYDVVERVAATVHVDEVRLRHAIENDDGGRKTSDSHFVTTSFNLRTPVVVSSTTANAEPHGFLPSEGHGYLSPFNNGHTNMPTTSCENCSGMSAGFRTICPVSICLSFDECFAMLRILLLFVGLRILLIATRSLAGFRTMPPPTAD